MTGGTSGIGRHVMRTMGEHIDYDCSSIFQREMTLDNTGDGLIDISIRFYNGR